MRDHTYYLQLFESYRWKLCSLGTKETELRKINSDISEGITSRDILDESWYERIKSEIEAIKNELIYIEKLISDIPETKKLLPCKLYLRLHYIAGCSLIETATEIGVSLTTLRRIRQRCEDYFDEYFD